MPYSEEIDGRIGRIVAGWKGITKKRMFGGTCYLLNGKMFSGVYRDFLIVRLGKNGAREALRSEHARPLDITGKPMKGWVMVSAQGFRADEELEGLLEEAGDFARSLPRK